MKTFDQLPQQIQLELGMHYSVDMINEWDEDTLIRNYESVLEDALDEGMLSRKDVKSKMKSFKKALRRVE